MSQYIEDYVEEYSYEIRDAMNKYLSKHPDRKVYTIAMCGGSNYAHLKAIVIYEDKDEV